MWQCIACKRELPEAAEYCSNCGADRPGFGIAAPEAVATTTPSASTSTYLLIVAVEDALASIGRSSVLSRAVLLLVSVAIFFSVGMIRSDLVSIMVFLGAILVHEFGHWIAMRLLGYRNTSIMFIPFLGALISGTDPQPSGTKHAVVSLFGPAIGIFLGMASGIAWLITRQPVLADCARISFFLNVFNLLPIYPLDGGQVLHATVFSRNTTADTVFRVVMVGMIVALALLLHWWALGVFGLLFLQSLGMRRRTGQVARELLPEIPPEERMQADHVPHAWVVRIVNELQKRLSRSPNAARAIASEVQAVWTLVCTRLPSMWASVCLLAFYAATFIVGVLSWAIFEFARNRLSQP